MSLDRDDMDQIVATKIDHIKSEATSRSHSPLSKSTTLHLSRSSSSQGLPRTKAEIDDPDVKLEESRNGHSTLETKPARTSKTSKSGKKNIPRVAPLFDDLPDTTNEANSGYQVVEACLYQNKFLGYTEHAMECDCQEEWSK